MVTRPIDPARLKEFHKIYLECGGNASLAATKFGISKSSGRQWAQGIREGLLNTQAEEVGFPAEQVSSYWVKTKEGSYHVKRDMQDTLDAIKDAFSNYEWSPIKIPPPSITQSDLLTIYPIADVHLALRSTVEDSGEDYDLDIAANRFTDASDKLFLQSPNSGTGLVLYLGDFTHANDDKSMTPRSGHILQVSHSIYPTVRRGIALAVAHTGKALEKHARVIIKVMQGNHDLETWIALVCALEAKFSDDPRVTVDTDERDYWFFRWGVTLLGAHHAHRLKPEQMAGAMAMECREDWGETLYRLFLHGHLHHRRTIEVLGVVVECMRTLASVDKHHSGKYGSGQSLISITIDKQLGEVSRSMVNLPPVYRRAVTV